ncbi:cytochrome c family protein, partial [Mesorhizobium sp. M1233]
LRDPQAMVKGTKRAVGGLKKDEDIANVIAYLKQFSK